MGPLLSSFWTTLMISGEYIKIFHLFLYVKYNNSQYFLKRSHIHIHVFMLETPLQCYLLLLLLLLLMLLLLLSHFSRVQLCATPETAAHQARRPWDSPGKNTGVGCHFLLQCMKWKVTVKSLSRVRLFVTPWTAAYQAPLSMGFSRQEYWSGVPLPSLCYLWYLPYMPHTTCMTVCVGSPSRLWTYSV